MRAMDRNITIIEKPDWVSWDAIHEVLNQAHKANRDKGIVMRKPSLPGSLIEKEIGKDGVMLIALDGTSIVGTAALLFRNCSTWFNKGPYGYMCFASVLPEYAGNGVYKRLCEEREKIAKNRGLKGLLFDTHHKNTRVIEINLRNGFKRVAAKNYGDHWNTIMFKRLDDKPYSKARCLLFYYYSALVACIITTIRVLFGPVRSFYQRAFS